MQWSCIYLLVAISLNVNAADPDWIYSGVFEGFEGQQYISGLGEGSSPEDARKQAYSVLGEQLKVSISSQSDIVREYRSTSDEMIKQESVDISISTQVSLDNIEGIQIVAQHYRPETGRYYALAVLNRSKTANRLSFKLEELSEEVRSLQKLAKQHFSGGKASQGFAAISKASKKFVDIIKNIELHQLFAKPGSNSLHREDLFMLAKEFEEYLAIIFEPVSIAAAGGLEQSGSAELGVSEPFRIIFKYGNERLRNIPVKVITDNIDARIEVAGKTDDQGQIDVHVRSWPYTGKLNNSINVGIDLYEDLFTSRSPVAELKILLSQKSEVSILLVTKIRSESEDLLTIIVNDGLSELLSDQNYDVLSDAELADRADYVLETKVTVVELPGLSGLKFSKIGGVIKIKSARSKKVLKILRIDSDATKAGALSNDDAAEKAAVLMIEAVRDELLALLQDNLGRN